jgi:hypothetical protein
MEQPALGTINIYLYENPRLYRYFVPRNTYDAYFTIELHPQVITLIQQGHILPIYFSEDPLHNDKTWVSMKSKDNFQKLVEEIRIHDNPVIFFFPESKANTLKAMFKDYNLQINFFAPKSIVTNKYCVVGINFNESKVYCTIIETPTGVN